MEGKNDNDISKLEENFLLLNRKGIGIVYTCKLKKLYDFKMTYVTNCETKERKKISTVELEPSVKQKYFLSSKRYSFQLYKHSGLDQKGKVWLMFENTINFKKTRFFQTISQFNYNTYLKLQDTQFKLATGSD
jgi:hypothetical protein